MRTAVLVLVQLFFTWLMISEYRQDRHKVFLFLAGMSFLGAVVFALGYPNAPTKPECPGYERWASRTDNPCD